MSNAAAGKAFAKVCRSAAVASARFAMLQPGDRVLAALSGGLDSFVMLETLLVLARKSPFDFSVQAVTFDPQFPGFNIKGIEDYCRERKIPHTVISMNIDQVLKDSPQDRVRRPCVWCSRLRRGHLYKLAREQKITKLALGHHADDLLESFFISLVRGQGLTTMGPNVPADGRNEGDTALRIVRPLALIPEQLVKTAAGYFEFPTAGSCMYREQLEADGDRAWAGQMLNTISRRIPDLRSLMLKSLGRVEAQWLLDERYLDQLKDKPFKL